MSTRCQILVRANDPAKFHTVAIYKHSDGYPSGVLPVLEPLVMEFAKTRGFDPEYLTAQIVRAFARQEEAHRVETLAKLEGKDTGIRKYYEKWFPQPMIGWGLESIKATNPGLHLDLEFVYVVSAMDTRIGKVEVYRGNTSMAKCKRLSSKEVKALLEAGE